MQQRIQKAAPQPTHVFLPFDEKAVKTLEFLLIFPCVLVRMALGVRELEH